MLLRAAKRLVGQGHVVWDIGANVGLFAFAAAAQAGPTGSIAAIEADTWLVQLLRASARAQTPASAPVIVVPVAISDRTGLARLSLAARSRSSNALEGYGQSQMGGVAETNTVISVTLDWLAGHLPRPDLVKIDVEGAEYAVLEGGAHLLNQVRPLFLIEVSSESSDGITGLLRDAGYDLFDMEVDEASFLKRSADKAVWNTVAIPREKYPMVCGQAASN